MDAGFSYKRSWRDKFRSASSSDKRTWPHLSFSAVQFLTIFIVWCIPWYYASVDWGPQYWIMLASCVVLTGAVVCNLYQLFHTKEGAEPGLSKALLPPMPAILFLGIAGWAVLQSLPMYSLEDSNGPNAVQIQRYFLGEEVPGMSESLQIEQLPETTAVTQDGRRQFITGEARDVKLSWSVEPLHTQAAASMMAVVALLIWIGRSFFSSIVGQTILFGALTLLGIAVALFGFSHVLSWDQLNLLGLGKTSSFGPFVSRNSAGCFLNICMAASLGLTTIAFTQIGKRKVDHRYTSLAASRWESLLTRAEVLIGQLTTLQIAAIIANAVLISSVFSTASRGASIAAIAAIIAVFLLNTGRGLTGGKLFLALVVAAIGSAFLLSFELDVRIRERLENTEWGEDFEVARRLVWSIAAKASAFYFSTGSGLGTFQYAHLPFQHDAITAWFYNSESLYWEALVSLGWVGGIAIAGVVATFAYTLWPRRQESGDGRTSLAPWTIAALYMFISVGLHSFFDFGMIVAACFSCAALMVGSIYGATLDNSGKSPAKKSRRRSSRRRLTDIARSESREVERSIDSDRDSGASFDLDKSANHLPFNRWLGMAIILSVYVAMLACCYYGHSALSKLANADRMKFIQVRQFAQNTKDRVIAPSVLLAGAWELNVEQMRSTPDANRLLGYALMNEFVNQRTIDVEKEVGLKPREAEAYAALTMTHIALNEAVARQIPLNDVYYSELQMQRWEKARELIEMAAVYSPLDWRNSYALHVLGFDLSEDLIVNSATRLNRLALHRPRDLVQLAVIEHVRGRPENTIQLFRSALRINIGLDTNIARLLAEWYPDGKVPTEVFEPDIDHLIRVARVFPVAKFPQTFAEILRRADVLAEETPRYEPKRHVYMMELAKLRGDMQGVYDNALEALRRNPTEWRLRLEAFSAAIRMGNVQSAEAQLQELRFHARGESQLPNWEKQLLNLKQTQ